MKNIFRTIGLAGLIALSSGCSREDQVIKEYTISGEDFNEKVGDLAKESYKTAFQVHSESTFRDYPGSKKPLPRAEVKEIKHRYILDDSVETIHIDLYFPTK